MKLLITIDTEEDNWNRYSKTDNPVGNIESLAELTSLFNRYAVRPTYLITYPVASTPISRDILKEISDTGTCEIGMHCHPWNTPPLDGKNSIKKCDTMLCNLAEDIVADKLIYLHDVIKENFGIEPISFRAGRYGFGPQVAKVLCRLGYRVDTSVTPYSSWVSIHGADYTAFGNHPFRFGRHGLQHEENDGPLLQVPVSVGYLQANFNLCCRIESYIEKNVLRYFRLKGILDKTGLLNKVWLSPELSTTEMMIKLAKRFDRMGSEYINMTFHSSSLKAGNNPFVQDVNAQHTIFRRIEQFVRFVSESGWESLTLSEFANSFLKK